MSESERAFIAAIQARRARRRVHSRSANAEALLLGLVQVIGLAYAILQLK